MGHRRSPKEQHVGAFVAKIKPVKQPAIARLQGEERLHKGPELGFSAHRGKTDKEAYCLAELARMELRYYVLGEEASHDVCIGRGKVHRHWRWERSIDIKQTIVACYGLDRDESSHVSIQFGV